MKKFDEFYFVGDNSVHQDYEYWDVYNIDRQGAIEKFDGKMFCPLCKKAPLTIARGEMRKYFKVVKRDMDKHDPNCSYMLKVATKRETKEFFDNLSKSDIKNRLTSCINLFLKKEKNKATANNSHPKAPHINVDIFSFKTKSKRKKYLSHISLNSKRIRDKMDIIKIYYGKCLIWSTKSPYKNSNNVYGCLLHILNGKTKKYICSISMSGNVKEYLGIDFKDSKEFAEHYYVSFAAEMKESKEGFLNCKVRDSRLIALEKIE